MSLSQLQEGEVLTVRTYKIVPGAEIAWANTYEVKMINAFLDQDDAANVISNIAEEFAAFERSLLNAAYTLDRVVISTYVPDSNPYNPFNFLSVPINLPGQYFTPGNPLLPLQFCTLIKRIVQFGRQGSILMRGIVAANDCDITPSGAVIKENRANAIINVLNLFIQGLQSYNAKLVMASGRPQVDTSKLRDVTGLELKRAMTFKKLNNRYFDVVRQ